MLVRVVGWVEKRNPTSFEYQHVGVPFVTPNLPSYPIPLFFHHSFSDKKVSNGFALAQFSISNIGWG